jgi:glycosyltransferase involved in cell wall biosynthesis
MRCPVIATRIGAPPETVIPAGAEGIGEATGWLVPSNDPDALAVALDQALALTEQERSALGMRARAHVASNFTLDAMKRATLAVYDELLETDLASRRPNRPYAMESNNE